VALYHFSEESDIGLFVPRSPVERPEIEPLVWAIDEWHGPMYYVPRDCPRACFWPGEGTSEQDRERWFTGVEARMVIAIESGWLSRVREGRLYRYTLPEDTFVLNDEIAGHWVSREQVEPTGADPVGDLLTAMTEAGVEVRITPSVAGLWERVIRSTLCYSGTRLRNARGYR